MCTGHSRFEHALALQMHYTAMALVRQDEAAVAQILRENNRFNDMLARIEGAAPPDERALIEQIRAAQDDAMAVVADIANFIREGKIDRRQARADHPRGAALPARSMGSFDR